LASTTGKNGNVLKSYPAQVVAPTDAEQVVSSSVAGLVQKIYVQPNQNVKAGAPLVSITSPELGQLQLQLLQGQTQARLALQTAQRERKLFSEGIIPKRRVQEAEAELQLLKLTAIREVHFTNGGDERKEPLTR
jgi:multidrug efflux pump subunit AcrA (membrane-fusion protein)